MLLKGIFCLCIQAVLFKSVFTQCIRPNPRQQLCSTNSFIEGSNLASVAPLTPVYGRIIGGNLIMDTTAPHAHIGPAGVMIFSDDLIIEGAVLVSGSLPFSGTVGLEGVVPSSGSGTVNYGCGTREIGIVEIPNSSVTEVVIPAGDIGSSGCSKCNTLG
ncbi:hypothetical protein PYW07_002477 [Mythimna separata]|uniref:Uncharacterized protein n=1 Tax=Mythimna separata TaxID=271217 RepID=A0AAD8DT37_MYTSE|nr:hypothetical protein PYW07_002477 [Mythimna separata]